MRLIDADAFNAILENGEIEAKKQRKYVLASALNTIRGNLAKQPSVSSSNCSEIPNNCKTARGGSGYMWMTSTTVFLGAAPYVDGKRTCMRTMLWAWTTVRTVAVT